MNVLCIRIPQYIFLIVFSDGTSSKSDVSVWMHKGRYKGQVPLAHPVVYTRIYKGVCYLHLPRIVIRAYSHYLSTG